MGSRSPMGRGYFEGPPIAKYRDTQSAVICPKYGSTDVDTVWVMSTDWPKESRIRWRSRSLHGNGAIFEESGPHCKVYKNFAVSCAKRAKKIDLPFGLWIPLGQVSTSSIVFPMWRQCARLAQEIRCGLDPAMGRGNFMRKGAHFYV